MGEEQDQSEKESIEDKECEGVGGANLVNSKNYKFVLHAISLRKQKNRWGELT